MMGEHDERPTKLDQVIAAAQHRLRSTTEIDGMPLTELTERDVAAALRATALTEVDVAGEHQGESGGDQGDGELGVAGQG